MSIGRTKFHLSPLPGLRYAGQRSGYGDHRLHARPYNPPVPGWRPRAPRAVRSALQRPRPIAACTSTCESRVKMSDRMSPNRGDGLSPSPSRSNASRTRRRGGGTADVPLAVIEMLEGRQLFAAGIAPGTVPWLTPRIGVGPTPTPPTPTPPTPTPPTPTPTSQILTSRPRVVFNDVRGGSGSSNVGLTISNSGTT